MRKLLLFVVSLAMVLGGLYWLAAELLWTPVIYFRFVIGAAVLVTLGVYLLWVDFIAPRLGVRTGEE